MNKTYRQPCGKIQVRGKTVTALSSTGEVLHVQSFRTFAAADRWARRIGRVGK